MQFLNITIKKAVFLLGFLPLMLSAQPKSNSPYNRFGFGDISDNNFIASQTMGGLGATFHSAYDINVVNPASLAYLRATSFDVGITARNASFSENDGSEAEVWSGNLAYLSLAFPLQNVVNDLLNRKKRNHSFGMAFTLKPFTKVGYDVNSSVIVDGVGEVQSNFQGQGGTFDFSWSTGFRYKQFAAGVNVGYLFGQTLNQSIIALPDLGFSETSLLEDKFVYRGFLYRFGLLYTINLDKSPVEGEKKDFKDRRITLGVHANSTTRLTTDFTSFQGSAIFFQGETISRDTLNGSEQLDVRSDLPSEIGAGVTYYSGEKFSLGVNYTATQWSKANYSLVNGSLINTFKLSFGGYYRPNYKSVGNYFSRVFYRFGAFYNRTPTVVPANAGVEIDDMGLTVGFGLPFFYQRKISHANLGFTFGLRGRNTIIRERYVRLAFSFTFNDDEWFIKRKYN